MVDDHKSEYEHHTQVLHSISLLSRGQELNSESLRAPGDELLQPAEAVEGASHYRLNSECPGVNVKPLPIILFSFDDFTKN